jgi:hypothetical protein
MRLRLALLQAVPRRAPHVIRSPMPHGQSCRCKEIVEVNNCGLAGVQRERFLSQCRFPRLHVPFKDHELCAGAVLGHEPLLQTPH